MSRVARAMDNEWEAGNKIPDRAWFCLRTHNRHEHIAARQLRQMEDVEVYNPRIRFRRPTRHGALLVTEAMFPNYLFAKFDWRTSLPRVHYAPSVREVVHFGARWPTVPDQVIEELRANLGKDEVVMVPKEVTVGEQVHVSGGIFHGLKAVVTQVIPGRDRVLILMDFLGRQTMVEVGFNSIVRELIRP